MNIDYNKPSLAGWEGKGTGILLAAAAIQDLVAAGYALAVEFVPKLLLLPLLFPIIHSNKHLSPLVVNKELSEYSITFTITGTLVCENGPRNPDRKWNLLSGSFTRSAEEQTVPKGAERKRRNSGGGSYDFLVGSITIPGSINGAFICADRKKQRPCLNAEPRGTDDLVLS